MSLTSTYHNTNTRSELGYANLCSVHSIKMRIDNRTALTHVLCTGGTTYRRHHHQPSPPHIIDWMFPWTAQLLASLGQFLLFLILGTCGIVLTCLSAPQRLCMSTPDQNSYQKSCSSRHTTNAKHVCPQHSAMLHRTTSAGCSCNDDSHRNHSGFITGRHLSHPKCSLSEAVSDGPAAAGPALLHSTIPTCSNAVVDACLGVACFPGLYFPRYWAFQRSRIKKRPV